MSAPVSGRALERRIDALVDDVARVGRQAEAGSHLAHLVDRLRGHCEGLFLLTRPSAGELVKWTAPGDPEAVDAAIEHVDLEWDRLRRRLGRAAA